MASSTHSKSSRLSSFKMFKSFGKDTERSLGGDLKPPPPPPKDPYYKYNNRSMASLSPDYLSLPNTPSTSSSPGYSLNPPPLPHPSSSSVSLVSTSAVSAVTAPDSTRGPKAKKSGFFKQFKRSSSKMSMRTQDSFECPPPLPDDGVSLPWNFQVRLYTPILCDRLTLSRIASHPCR